VFTAYGVNDIRTAVAKARALARARPRDHDPQAGPAAPSRQEQKPRGQRDYGGRNARGPSLRPPPPPLRGSHSDHGRGRRSYWDGPDQNRNPATSVKTNNAQAAPTSQISARVGPANLVLAVGSSASSSIRLPLRHRCARQAGRLIAREHREPRPACSPKVLYSAGHPTEAGACVHRECGRSSRSRLERETGLRRCLPLGKSADSSHCFA